MISEQVLLIITKDLVGQLSDYEKRLLKDWLSESNENSDLYHSYKEAFLNGKYQPTAKNKDEVYQRLSQRLQFTKHSVQPEVRENLNSAFRISQRWLKVAATILVFVATSFIIYQTRIYWQSETESQDLSHDVIIKSNPRGKKSLIVLPDGSRVKLNSESHLEYYSDFSNDRSVKLVGEAFFEIVKDTLRPFYVNSGDLRVRVLGTSFNVKAFPFEEKINVAVVSGEVLIEKKKKLQMKPVEYLKPEEMFVYDHQTTDYDITKFDKKTVIGWKDGELHFDETDFDTVIKILERWYGVEIIVSSNAHLTGRFNANYKNQPLEMVLEGMAFTSDFDFIIKGKKVYIE